MQGGETMIINTAVEATGKQLCSFVHRDDFIELLPAAAAAAAAAPY